MPNNDLNKALEYFHENKLVYKKQLEDLISIPSVSFDGWDKQNLIQSAELVAKQLRESGLANVEILNFKEAPPYVWGETPFDPNKKTVLLYAHHDVQPPMRDEIWDSPAFKADTRNGRLYGRGSADDKAGISVHVASIAAYMKTIEECPVNIKVLIEGEEEVGSPHFDGFLEQYKERLQTDCLIILDSTNYDTGTPSLTTSLRGLVACDVTVKALKSPLHSGMWGGPLPDPIMALTKLLADLVDSQGMPTIPELLEDIVEPSQEEIESWKSLGMNNELFRSQSGLLPKAELFGKDWELLKKMWKQPSLLINSIESGGKKIAGNVIMDEAWARVGVRIVPNQSPQKVMGALKKYFEANCPWGLTIEIKEDTAASAWTTEIAHPIFNAAKKTLTEGYNKEAVWIGCGGSIPLAETFEKTLGKLPILLVGIEDPLTNAHSENESLSLDDFYKAINSQIRFFDELSSL